MKEIIKMDEAGISFLVNEEGIVLHPYLDKNKVATIGVGSTWWEDGSKVKMSDKPITRERAIALFKTTLKHYELTVYSTTRDDINQHQFNSLVSICYNIGVNGFKSSTLLRLVNTNPNDPAISEAFKMWKKPDLLQRRIREANMYFAT